MKFHSLALCFLALTALTSAEELRQVRFPTGDEKTLAVFIAETEPQLANDAQRRVWRNALTWMREEADAKNGDFWKWLSGMHAADMAAISYTKRTTALSDEIDSLTKAAATAEAEEAARLKARAAELRKTRDSLHEEVWSVLTPPNKAGKRLYPEAPR